MQNHLRTRDTAGFDLIEQSPSEVQTRRRCRQRTRHPGEDRLASLSILLVLGWIGSAALDVGRQGRLADRVGIRARGERQGDLAIFVQLADLGVDRRPGAGA